MTTTTRQVECTPGATPLLMAMELGRHEWRLGFTIGVGQRPRRRTLRTDDWQQLPHEITAAKARFGLPADAVVLSCFEAGRDGFWVHRYLT